MNIYEEQFPEPGQPAIDPNIAPKKPKEIWDAWSPVPSGLPTRQPGCWKC